MTTHPCGSSRASGALSPTFSAWPSTSSPSPAKPTADPPRERGETVRAMVLQAAAHTRPSPPLPRKRTRRRTRSTTPSPNRRWANATMMPWRERLIHSLGLCVPRPRRHRIDAPGCRSPHTPPASASPRRPRRTDGACPAPPGAPSPAPRRRRLPCAARLEACATPQDAIAGGWRKQRVQDARRPLDEPGMRSGPKRTMRATQMNRETQASRRVPHTSWDSPREETNW